MNQKYSDKSKGKKASHVLSDTSCNDGLYAFDFPLSQFDKDRYGRLFEVAPVVSQESPKSISVKELINTFMESGKALAERFTMLDEDDYQDKYGPNFWDNSIEPLFQMGFGLSYNMELDSEEG